MIVDKLANDHAARDAVTTKLLPHNLKHNLAALIHNFFFFLLQALYNEYVHFKETEIPAKENEKGHIEHLYKLLEVRVKEEEVYQRLAPRAGARWASWGPARGRLAACQ